MAVRRQLSGPLRSKLDSMDIVQSVWADVLCGFRRSGVAVYRPLSPSAFLVKVARNRLIDRRRQHHRAIEQERPLDPAAAEDLPKATSLAPARLPRSDELWKRMLEECTPAHREILILKRQGLPNDRDRPPDGLHEGSIRRILYELARRLADPAPVVGTRRGRRRRSED